MAKLTVLVLRFSSIGDIVLTTPVLRGLHQQADAQVHVLTKSRYADLLQPNPYVHTVHTFEREVTECLPSLRALNFDHIVDLHNNLRSRRVRWSLRRPATAFDKLNVEKWLLTQLKINRLPNVHIVQRYLATVHQFGVQPDGLGLDYFIPKMEAITPTSIDSALLPNSYIAFAIGAAHATKRLPPEKLWAICEALSPLPLVLLGGPDEQSTGVALADAFSHVVNACGRTNLHGSASLIQQARVVLSHDTGMMHIAAALRRPIVSIWGNTVPAFGMYPWLPGGLAEYVCAEVADLDCRPCSKIGYAACPKKHFRCMREQRVEWIVEQVRRLGNYGSLTSG